MKSLIIAVREIKSLLTDKGDIAFSFLLPLVMLGLMYGAFGGGQSFSGTAYIVDSDNGVYARRIVGGLRDVSGLSVSVLSKGEAQELLSRSDILMVTEIPAGFSERLENGESVSLKISRRGNGGMEGQIVASIVRSVVADLEAELIIDRELRTFIHRAGMRVPEEVIKANAEQTLHNLETSPPVGVREVTVGTKSDPLAWVLPGIASMFILFGVSLTASSLALERKRGILERLLTAGASVNQIFLGKWMANLARGMVQLSFLFLVGFFAFDFLTISSLLQIVAFGLIAVFAVSAIGMLVGSLAKTADQAAWISVFFTMTMSAFGGTFFDANVNKVTNLISKVTYNHYANTGFRALIGGGKTILNLGTEILALLAMGAVLLVLAKTKFKVAQEG